MPQILTLPGVALQWKAVGPFNQAPQATVSIQPHFPFGDGAVSTGTVVFPATNVNASSASFFATPLVGVFDQLGRLVGQDGYPLVVPPLDQNSVNWLQRPTLYEIQIDILGMSSQRGVFVAFQNSNSNFSQGNSGVLTNDANSTMSATTSNGHGGYDGTLYLGDTIVHPILVNQLVNIEADTEFSAVVNSIDLPTNSMSITTTAAQPADSNVDFFWGNGDNGDNLAVDLSQYVNWLA